MHGLVKQLSYVIVLSTAMFGCRSWIIIQSSQTLASLAIYCCYYLYRKVSPNSGSGTVRLALQYQASGLFILRRRIELIRRAASEAILSELRVVSRGPVRSSMDFATIHLFGTAIYFRIVIAIVFGLKSVSNGSDNYAGFFKAVIPMKKILTWYVLLAFCRWKATPFFVLSTFLCNC